MKLEEIQHRIERLYRLTQEPHPAEMWWNMELGEQIEQLIRAWQGEVKEKNK
jgi:hypothetical protein